MKSDGVCWHSPYPFDAFWSPFNSNVTAISPTNYCNKIERCSALPYRLRVEFLAYRCQIWLSIRAMNSEIGATDRRYLPQFMTGCDTRDGRNDIGNNYCQDHLEDPLSCDLAGNDGVSVINRDEKGPNH